ncbi:sensor histidine kinase [Gulosibacter bifidus]|uniref:histidine kinase n=1 Tax=Gulosibacter bifidus TaxID=272239 RepID=A0ABW5RJS4_9MICO|nr:HAMP domain-containing sensor histidine kinase [Gulosibacter bifidus]
MSRPQRTKRWKRRRFTARTQLAFSYALLMILCGGVLLALMALFIGYVPDYGFASPTGSSEHGPLVIAVDDPENFPEDFAISVKTEGDFLTLLLQVSLIALLVLVVLSSVAAWLLAGRMLKPLAAVNNAARLAADGRFDHRIGYQGPKDEITELAQTFDQMLDNLERFTVAQRRFTANASHELRTPLATTRTILEVALMKPDMVDRDVLLKLKEVNARSTRTVEALLDLAELEAGKVSQTECDLSQTVRSVLQDFEAEIERRGLTVTTQLAQSTAYGDEQLFRQLVQNLVQNAIQHNVDGGDLTVSTTMDRAGDTPPIAVVMVRNSGEIVDSSELGRLLEPFETKAGRTGRGNRGLGLSIVSAIVDRACGKLDIAANEDGGLCVTVILPACPEQLSAHPDAVKS